MTPSRSSGPRQRGRRTGTGPRERLSALLARLPWWVDLTVGVVASVVGAFLTLAPFASLAVLVIAVVVGLGIWGIRHGQVPHISFIIVASTTSAILLLGWRAIAAASARRAARR